MEIKVLLEWCVKAQAMHESSWVTNPERIGGRHEISRSKAIERNAPPEYTPTDHAIANWLIFTAWDGVTDWAHQYGIDVDKIMNDHKLA